MADYQPDSDPHESVFLLVTERKTYYEHTLQIARVTLDNYEETMDCGFVGLVKMSDSEPTLAAIIADARKYRGRSSFEDNEDVQEVFDAHLNIVACFYSVFDAAEYHKDYDYECAWLIEGEQSNKIPLMFA